MELIRQIKQAEQEARDIVDQGRAETVLLAEEGRNKHAEQTSIAQAQRRKAIDEAVAQAQEQGQAEVEQLRAQSQEQIEQLRQRASARMDGCVERVVQEIGNL